MMLAAPAAFLAGISPMTGMAAPVDPAALCGNLHSPEARKLFPPTADDRWTWTLTEQSGKSMTVHLDIKNGNRTTFAKDFRCHQEVDGTLHADSEQITRPSGSWR